MAPKIPEIIQIPQNPQVLQNPQVNTTAGLGENNIFSLNNNLLTPDGLMTTPLSNNFAMFDFVGDDLRNLMAAFTPRNYTPEQIGEMNSRGIYTSASEMTPEMIKNITNGRVKDVKAGKYGGPKGVINSIKTFFSSPIKSIKDIFAGRFGGVKLNEAQVNNAKIIASTIVDVGKKQNKSDEQIKKAVIIALATAMQESGIKNIGYGDRDSVGLFQQRPSCGWGSPEQCQDPVYATRKFAEKLYKTDYMNKSVTGAAQNVQRSAFPNAYAKWQDMAEDLANKMLS